LNCGKKGPIENTHTFATDEWVSLIRSAIAEEAARIRRSSRIKLPDAIIWASAKVTGARLVTRNTQGFPSDDPFVHLPYQV
jgi:predicted nucleic acid-binding protein